jgi:hypothetical protein
MRIAQRASRIPKTPPKAAQQNAFRQQLPHQPPAARAQRETHGKLGARARPPGQQQIRDIGACNQQDDSYHRHQYK